MHEMHWYRTRPVRVAAGKTINESSNRLWNTLSVATPDELSLSQCSLLLRLLLTNSPLLVPSFLPGTLFPAGHVHAKLRK